jgi:hypothetical protein
MMDSSMMVWCTVMTVNDWGCRISVFFPELLKLRFWLVLGAIFCCMGFVAFGLRLSRFDAQFTSAISGASELCAPVHLSEMKDEPENLFV